MSLLSRHRLLLWILLAVLLFFSLPAVLYHRPKLWYLSSGSDATTLSSRRLFHLLPVNREGAGPLFCKVLMSSLIHGYSPIILNWEAQGDENWMQRLKVAGVYEFLRDRPSLNDDDVVFMMDAWDVWLQLPPQILLERFEELGSNKVVIGADMACWPNDLDEPACRDVPQSPVPHTYGEHNTQPRWANSGTIIGTAKSMKEVYKDLMAQLSDRDWTDQGIFNEFLHQRRITLDYWSRLFWANAANVDAGVIINTRYPVSTVEDKLIPYHLLPPMAYHSHTGEYPVAIHFNDRFHKYLMDDWWGHLWWQQPSFKSIWQEKLESGTAQFAHNGSTVHWKDICGDVELSSSVVWSIEVLSQFEFA
ncbi:hypothetical protein B0H11DRAFT_2052815 [Mycena galericulata]|nr:hypothetical protein B0H11DRAFT_2052815 [Mycena galericulata]